LRINPNLYQAWDNKVWAFGCLGKYPKSLQCIERALDINPSFATALYRMGWTLKKLGKNDEAEQYFDKARLLGYEG
jgi:tetratricopeptide (TPR) repeat protein